MSSEADDLALAVWRGLRMTGGLEYDGDDLPDATTTREAPSFDEAIRLIGRDDAGCRREELRDAFVVVSGWAEEKGYLRTSAACAEMAAHLVPQDPAPALLSGRLARRLANDHRAETWYVRGAALARCVRDWELYIQALLWHGFLHFQRAEYAQAERKYRSAGRAATRYGRRALAGVAHHNLLTLASDLGSYENGERHALKAVHLYPVHYPRLPHLVHDYAFLLARNRYFTAGLALLELVYPLILSPAERIVVVGNLARTAGGARIERKYHSAVREVVQLAELSDENASRGLLGAAEGAHHLGLAVRAVDFATLAMAAANRRGDNEVHRLAGNLIDQVRTGTRSEPDRGEPSHHAAMLRLFADRLRRWASTPRGQAANMLRKHAQPNENAASTGWRRPAA